MPFGKYKDFDACVRANKGKKNPKAYCAFIQQAVEGMPAEHLNGFLEWFDGKIKAGWFKALLSTELDLMTTQQAQKVLREGQKALKNVPPAVLIDDHRWLHLWEKTIQRKDKLFLSKSELRKLHEIIVSEMANRGMKSGKDHKSPMSFSVMMMGDRDLMRLVKNREEFLVDPAFISLIGSTLQGKEGSDLDILLKSSHSDDYKQKFLQTVDEDLADRLDLVWDMSGANGPSMPLYELWARPVENATMADHTGDIVPLSPIPPPMPSMAKDKESIYELFEDSYYVTEAKGKRIMIHRSETGLMAFDKEMDEFDIPSEVRNELLEVKDPRTFILDGFLVNDVFHMMDMPWWRLSEHIKQPATVRKNFLKKIPTSGHVQHVQASYFKNRAETISYLKESNGIYYLIPGSSLYGIDGSSDWMLFGDREKTLSLAAPKPIEAEEIKGRTAFLVSGRYAEESSIACCATGWMAVEEGTGFSYFPNTPQGYEHVKELGVGTLVGVKATRQLLDTWRGHNMSFVATNQATIRDYHGRKDLVDYTYNDEISVNMIALKNFYGKIRPGSEMEARLQGENPYLIYPDEKRTWKYVLQYHVRGLSVHGDFRAELDDNRLIGWTWDTGKSLVKVMLLSEDEATVKKYTGLSMANLKEADIAEVSELLEKRAAGKQFMGELTKRVQEMSFEEVKKLAQLTYEMETKLVIENSKMKMFTQTKKLQPHEWLTTQGEFEPGVHFITMDEGTIEYGTQKSWFHEYFLHGGKMDGRRLVVRRLTTKQEWDVEQKFAWVSFFSKKDAIPYALSRRAASQDWHPPQGVSAIPRHIREQIPSRYRYWKKRGNREELRDNLVKDLSRKKVAIKLAAGLHFSVKRMWHKDQKRYWLVIHDGIKVLDAWDFGRDTDPLAGEIVTAQRHDVNLQKLISATGANFDTSDEGSVVITSDSNNLVRLSFNGTTLNGQYVFVNKDEEWSFRKAEITEEKKAMLLMAAQCTTGVCSTSGVMHLAANDMKITRQGDLLLLDGPAIKPGEVLPMDGTPTYFTKRGIKAFWPSMYRQPVVVLHGDLKGDVIGFVDKIHFDPITGWGVVDRAVIWHPLGIEMILSGKLPAFSIEVIPETIWDAVMQHELVIGGRCVGLAMVPKGACVTCRPTGATMGNIEAHAGKVYKLGMNTEAYLGHLYYTLRLSTTEISQREGIPRTTVENWLEKGNIPRRTLAEARQLRGVKEKQRIELGGRAFITVLGSGEGPHRNNSSTLFSIGTEPLIINAPKNITDLLGIKGIKPKYVLVDGTRDSIMGLHQMRSLKPGVIASSSTWKYLRENYEEITGEKGDFDDIYNFDRKILDPGKRVEFGPYQVQAFADSKGVSGYLLNIGGQRIWHGAHSAEIPEKWLEHVDIYIGNGSSMEHMKAQIKQLTALQAGVIYFTKISDMGIDQDSLTAQVQELAPNAGILFDGAELSLGGDSPSAYYPKALAQSIMSGDVKLVVRNKPYSEYSRQGIMVVDGEKGYGIYVEGMPEGPFEPDMIKPLAEQHGLTDELWTKLVGDAKRVWTYSPRVLRKFDEPKPIRATEPSGPYIHNTKMIL